MIVLYSHLFIFIMIIIIIYLTKTTSIFCILYFVKFSFKAFRGIAFLLLKIKIKIKIKKIIKPSKKKKIPKIKI